MNRFDRERWDTMGKEALSRVEELMNTSRINELIHKREEDEKKKNCILWVLAIIGAVAAVAGIAYAVYRFFTPDYLEDFEDDFDDDFDDDRPSTPRRSARTGTPRMPSRAPILPRNSSASHKNRERAGASAPALLAFTYAPPAP